MVNRCPVTAGLPTKITKAGFGRSCRAFRDKAAEQREKGRGVSHHVCLMCDATPPEEVEFLRLEQFTEGKDMTGKCERCNKEGMKLQTHFKKNVCSSCAASGSFIKNNPSVAVGIIREFHHLPALLTEEEKETVLSWSSGVVKELKEHVCRLETQLAKESIDKQPATCEEVVVADGYSKPGPKLNGDSRVSWELALGIISGNVQGVSLEHLETIRELEG